MRAAGLIAAAVLLATASGCRVDDGFLDRDLFLCSAPGDCGDGWGCVRETPYTPNFCASLCDETSCDGACVASGTADYCIRGCLIGDDGRPGPCPSDDYSCVRTSIEHNDGLCYPVTSCDSPDDCPPGQACLSSLLADLGIPGDNLYCIPTPELEPCPGDSYPDSFSGGDSPQICWPNCSVTDTRCPPAFACLTQLDQLAEFSTEIPGASCTLGTYGLSCQDDSNCFIGACRDTGNAQGKICTVTCNEASRIAGGCENLIRPLSVTALLYTLECDPGAPSEDGSGLCTVRYSINFPGCTQDPDGAFPCHSDLSCRESGFAGVNICTKDCVADFQCNEGRPMDMWVYECSGRQCTFRQEP